MAGETDCAVPLLFHLPGHPLSRGQQNKPPLSAHQGFVHKHEGVGKVSNALLMLKLN